MCRPVARSMTRRRKAVVTISFNVPEPAVSIREPAVNPASGGETRRGREEPLKKCSPLRIPPSKSMRVSPTNADQHALGPGFAYSGATEDPSEFQNSVRR
jgi:hypothetical protein